MRKTEREDGKLRRKEFKFYRKNQTEATPQDRETRFTTCSITQLTRLHTVRAKEAIARGFGQANLVRSIGETWFVDPRYGKGSYWFYLMDGDTIVVSMDITYERAVEAAIETVPIWVRPL